MAFIISEEATASKVTLTGSDGNKVYFEAILQTCDVKNRNGRIYALNVMRRAIDEIRDRISSRTFGGELDHPIVANDETGWMRHTTFKWSEASHIFTRVWFDGNKIMGSGETLRTPNGYTLAGLIKDNVRIGFSLRGVSNNLRRGPNGVMYVEPPVTVVGYDAVALPSHKESYLTEVKNIESVEVPHCEDGICVLKEHLAKCYRNQQMIQESVKPSKKTIVSLFSGEPLKWR